MSDLLHTASVWVLPVLLAITLHEAAHAWAAWRLGDDTAKRRGRVSFNPLVHVHPVGTILLPGMMLLAGMPFVVGYARPVPVAFHRLSPRRLGLVLVAAAGPAANLVLAVVSLAAIDASALLPDPAAGWVAETAFRSVLLNVLLAVFNLLPVPPLDGGRILAALLPARIARRLEGFERFGVPAIIGLLFLLPWLLGRLGVPLDIFGLLVWQPTEWIIQGLTRTI